MALRVLFPVMTYPDATPLVALPRAVDLAATLGAQITAIVEEVVIPPIKNPVADFLLGLERQANAAEQLSRQTGEQIAEELNMLCHHSSVHLTIEKLRAERPSGELLAARARVHDLTMLACQPESPDHALLEQDVLFGSGGPVVIFPAIDTPAHVSKVAIAWDGSRAAARTVRDALPLLGTAGSISLLTCTQDKAISSTSIDGVLALLQAHGISAEHVPVSLGNQEVGEALQGAALSVDAGLMVMGAYGHSRVREFILGGATTSALTAPKLPLFMSH